MCFRPAGATKPVKCPKCGTFNRPTATKCQKCGYTGEEEASAKQSNKPNETTK